MPRASLPHIPPLNVPHREQTQSSDCLAACAAMVLAYLGRPVDYARLLAILQIGPVGAPRRNVLRLTRLGLDVTYREATFSLIATHLQAGQPVIAFVDTGELAYWSVTTNHAIVVIGLEAEHVIVHDPAFAATPQRIPFGEFEVAWLNCDNACAVVTVCRPT
jgi:ABC-type bacteriocin/lantibiotic exporter with double-glycine peptidase domain